MSATKEEKEGDMVEEAGRRKREAERGAGPEARPRAVGGIHARPIRSVQDLHGSCPLLWHWVLDQIPTVSVVPPWSSPPLIDLESENSTQRNALENQQEYPPPKKMQKCARM